MAKNLKDIVDEGFTRLAELAQKRKEILARSEAIATSSGPQSEAFEQKLKTSEVTYVSEINKQVDQLLEDLRQTLVQVGENKEIFQTSVKETLRLEVAGILQNAEQSRDHAIKAASERLDTQFLKVEKNAGVDKQDFSYEAEKLLLNMDRLCRRSQANLNQIQSDAFGKLAQAKNEYKTGFGETLASILKKAEASRLKAGKTVDRLFDDQADDIEKANKKLDGIVAKVALSSLDDLKDFCKKLEKTLEETKDKTLAEKIEELKNLSKDSLSELEDSCEYSKTELNQKLNELKELSAKLLEQEQQSIDEIGENAMNSSMTICSELRSFSGNSFNDGANAIEDCFKELNEDFGELEKDLGQKLKELLKKHADGMEKLGVASEKSFSDLFSNYKVQLCEMIKIQDQLFAQKEEDLHRHLGKLEKQIDETSSQLEGAGGSKK